MSRIDDKYAVLKASDQKALICFVTAGDPDIQTTRRIVLELEKAGADIVELGIPFSDPIADGVSIQAASMRALEHNVNVSDVLKLVKDIRRDSQLPIVLMTYFNPVMRYGTARFAADAASAGADGVIITDLTPEESAVWKSEADKSGLNTIYLLAPTSTDERMVMVSKLATGFIYCVSRTGVTGTGSTMSSGAEDTVKRIRAFTDKPVAVGFGISSPEHVRDVCAYADGAIVGSKLVDRIAASTDSDHLIEDIKQLVSALKSGTSAGN